MPRAATLADFMRTCLVMSVILYFPIFAVYVTAIFPQFTKIGPHAPAQWSDPSPFLGPCPSLTFDSRQAPPRATLPLLHLEMEPGVPAGAASRGRRDCRWVSRRLVSLHAIFMPY